MKYTLRLLALLSTLVYTVFYAHSPERPNFVTFYQATAAESFDHLSTEELKALLKERYQTLTKDGQNPYYLIRDMILADADTYSCLTHALNPKTAPDRGVCLVKQTVMHITQKSLCRILDRYRKEIVPKFQEYCRRSDKTPNDTTLQMEYVISYCPTNIFQTNYLWDLRICVVPQYLYYDLRCTLHPLHTMAHSLGQVPDYQNFEVLHHSSWTSRAHVTITVTIPEPRTLDGSYEAIIACWYYDPTNPIE